MIFSPVANFWHLRTLSISVKIYTLLKEIICSHTHYLVDKFICWQRKYLTNELNYVICFTTKLLFQSEKQMTLLIENCNTTIFLLICHVFWQHGFSSFAILKSADHKSCIRKVFSLHELIQCAFAGFPLLQNKQCNVYN